MLRLEFNLLIDPPFRRKLSRRWFRRAVAEALDCQGISNPTEVGLLVTGDELVAELNGRYRGKQRTTDVLSFSLDGESVGEGPFVSPPGAVHNLGEVIISYPQAARQALEHGHDVKDELAFLTVHGIFHLLGHDHEEAGEAELMRELETRALAGLGIDRVALFSEREYGD